MRKDDAAQHALRIAGARLRTYPLAWTRGARPAAECRLYAAKGPAAAVAHRARQHHAGTANPWRCAGRGRGQEPRHARPAWPAWLRRPLSVDAVWWHAPARGAGP